MPKNFVHARNANGRVAMGLHGYRVYMVAVLFNPRRKVF